MVQEARKRKLENTGSSSTCNSCTVCTEYENKKQYIEFLIWRRSRYENSNTLKHKLYLLKLDFNEHMQLHLKWITIWELNIHILR